MKRLLATILLGSATFALMRVFFSPAPFPVADQEALVAKFAETAFKAEHGGHPGSVYRWETRVVLYIDGLKSNMYSKFVEDVASQLTLLTARQVTPLWKLLPESPRANFIVVLGDQDYLNQRLKELPAMSEFIKLHQPYGYATVGGDGREILGALAAVRDDRPDDDVRTTLLEEISQGFGVMNDTDIVQPSIWSDTSANFDRLPLNDQIILRALYDPAIRPGMPKEEAMEIVRDLIPRLVEAVKKEGEAALYQR